MLICETGATQAKKERGLSTETTIFIGVGIYIVLMIAIGVYASGRTHTVTEFIVAGRGLPVWLCSTTIVATWFGGGTMMGASGAAYDNGMLGVIADPLGASLGPRLSADTFRLLPGENTGEQWLNYLRAWTIVGLVVLSAQTLMQRALAAKSERAAQNSFYLGGGGYLVFGMIPVTLGIIASVSMPGLADSEAVIPSLAIEHLDPVAVAIFVGALLAAIIVPFILGVWWKKANRTGALSAMAAGLSAWLLTLFVAPQLPADFIGLGVSLLTMLVVTPLTQSFDPPRTLVDSEGQPVEMTDRLGTLPLFGREA